MLVNTTEYGHLDCLDEAMFQLAATIHLCAANKELDREVYRNYIAGDTSEADIFSYILHLPFLGEVVAFLRYFQPGSGDCSLLGRLTSLDPGVLGWVETKGAVAEQCGGGACTWSPQPRNFIRL